MATIVYSGQISAHAQARVKILGEGPEQKSQRISWGKWAQGNG